MNIQSLSIVVPNKGCINACKFCVAHMIEEDYENFLKDDNTYYDLYERDYIDRLEFARDNGCNTVMLTGNSEPQQNRSFLKQFGTMNRGLNNPFKIVEMQTTGVLLDNKYLYFLRRQVGVNTISLSISAFDDDVNADYNQSPKKLKISIAHLCEQIKKYRFNLRLSINLTDYFDHTTVQDVFKYCKELGADQVTFRVLYQSDEDTEQDRWMQKHSVSKDFVDKLASYIKLKGRKLERLEFGAMKYSVNEMSVVLDSDCMSTEDRESLKYLILRENCKLYSKWDDKGSLIF